MDFLQNVDPGNALLLAVGCVLLCVVGYVLLSVLQILGSVLGFLGSIFGIFFDILGGGPISWCGCLLVLVGCVGCGGLALFIAQSLSGCGTPQAVNFCSFFGR